MNSVVNTLGTDLDTDRSVPKHYPILNDIMNALMELCIGTLKEIMNAFMVSVYFYNFN